jgi:hypothetical protein
LKKEKNWKKENKMDKMANHFRLGSFSQANYFFFFLYPQLTFQSNLPRPSRLITSYRSRGGWERGWVRGNSISSIMLFLSVCVCVCTGYLFIDSVIVAKGGYGRVECNFSTLLIYFSGVRRKEKKMEKVGKKHSATTNFTILWQSS